jgi:arabinose-5-phosphate isomerase
MSPAATSETTSEYVRAEHAHYIASAAMMSTEISQLPLDAVVAALEIARAAGTTTILDVDVPPSDALQSLGTQQQFEAALRLSDYLKPSKAAAIELTGITDALEAAKALRTRYPARAVVITDGENGCAISSDDFTDRVPARRIKAFDSTGAGDAFLGGMITGLHHGLSWRNTLLLANACGAACCELSGATPDLATSKARVLDLYEGEDAISLIGTREGRTSGPLHGEVAVNPYENAVQDFLDIAISELSKLRGRIDAKFLAGVADLLVEVERKGGRIHFTGIGKPEYVAGYLSALFSSTGTPSYFLHGTECVHGSAGQVARGDAVIAISNSGETAELKATVTALRRNGAVVVGVSGNSKSWLAKQSDAFLHVGVEREGSPLGFEPRASILAEIYVLAALSIELQGRKGISLNEYNAWHPGGLIGKHTGELKKQ